MMQAGNFRVKGYRFITILAFVLAVFCGTAAASGGLDPTFAPNIILGGGEIRAFAVQPDGKVLLGGTFEMASGVQTPVITRINSDGTIDPTFHPPQFNFSIFPGGAGSIVLLEILLQPDGKILIGGNIYFINGTPHPTLARLNSDGSLDTSFNFNPAGSIGYSYFDLDLQPDGKILIGGGTYSAVNRNGLTRVNTDGSVDLSFAPANHLTSAVKILPDGKILVSEPDNSTQGFIRRYNNDGSIDPTFIVSYSGGVVTHITALSDSNFFISGNFTNVNNVPKGSAAKISSSGTLDTSFNAKGSGFSGPVYDAIQEADGKIIVSGGFSTYNDVSKPRVVRLNTDGSLDDTFATFVPLDSPYVIYRAFPISGGKYLVTGYKYWPYPIPSENVKLGFAQRLNNDGTADNSFANVYTGGGSEIDAFALLNGGHILAGGPVTLSRNQPLTILARFDNGGVLDTSFLPFFNVGSYLNAHLWTVEAFAVQPDNKVIVSGQMGVKRINPDGTFDAGFNAVFTRFEEPNDLLLLPDGKILVSGSIHQRPIIRLNSDGSVDPAFEEGQAGTNFGRSKIALQADGKIIIAGEFLSMGGASRNRIARLNSDGSLDNSFNPVGGVNNRILTVAVQPDGKILIGGEFNMVNGFTKKNIARLNSDGSTDASFSPNITAPNPGSIFNLVGVASLKVLKTGKILIGGNFSAADGQPRNNIARLNSDGSLDTTFDVGGTGPEGIVRTLAVQPNGCVLVGGNFVRFNGQIRTGMARLIGGGPLFDFDGDGRSDISVFRPSDGNWYLNQSTGGLSTQHFGMSGDRITSADYDGDGKSDLAIYRNGDWWYINSSNGSLGLKSWGTATDIALPSDFDGDGKADFIYYRPSTGEWFRSGSLGVNMTVQFGIGGDIPVIGDFDGDGKADPAIFRPSNGQWWYQSSTTGGAVAAQWGQSGDVPVAADYDGDGRADIAVWRPSNGAWYVYNSSNGTVSIFGWGLAEDKPVAADYDGDGRADVAVWRPSSGVWYIMQTTAGFTGMQYGLSSDKPIPNAFLP
jgi:uncharacterized delta-60 repeat protein